MISVPRQELSESWESLHVSQFQEEKEEGELEILRTRNECEVQIRDMNCHQEGQHQNAACEASLAILT